MTLKNTFILSCIFLLNIHFTYAQKNFLPGEITKKDGSIIKGLIDYKNWNINPKKISFKKSIESKTDIYSTEDINSFKVSNDHYIRANINYETSPLSLENLSFSAIQEIKSTITFLKVISEGKKSLYHYKDASFKSHFYIYQNNVYQLLGYKKYLKSLNGEAVIAEINRFKNQLAYYLKEYKNIQLKLENAKYNEKSLSLVFKYYYAYTD